MASPDKPVVSVIGDQPSVDPEPLRFRRSQRNVTIIWRLETPGFVFTSDGIRIDGEVVGGGVQPQAEIVDGRLTANGRQFVWLNKNTRPGTYKYTIRVQAPGGPVLEKDPSIINGNDL